MGETQREFRTQPEKTELRYPRRQQAKILEEIQKGEQEEGCVGGWRGGILKCGREEILNLMRLRRRREDSLALAIEVAGCCSGENEGGINDRAQR